MIEKVPHGSPGKGQRTAGSGRKPGQPNHLTKSVRDAVRLAFDEVGGVDALVALHRDHPDIFFRMVEKLMPAEVVTDITVTMNIGERLTAARTRIQEYEEQLRRERG